MYKFTLPGDWSDSSANKELNRAKNNKHVYESAKKKTQNLISEYIHLELHGVRITEPFAFVMVFYCKNRATDPTNHHFLSKHVLDAAQNCKLITNDGWFQVAGNVAYEYEIDKDNPRVEVFFLCGVKLRHYPNRLIQQHGKKK